MPDDKPTEVAVPHPSIHTVAVKLSPFSTQAPISWFRRAEVQFRLRKISDSHTKADYVLEAMPEDIFTQISLWLEDFDGAIRYDDLKRYLLGKFTLTPSVRAQKLLSFPSQPLGDRSADTVWNEMQALARLPVIDQTTNQHRRVDLMRELWLQVLPPAVRAALPDSDSLSMPDLVEAADKLIDAAKASHHSAHFGAVSEVGADINFIRKRNFGNAMVDRKERFPAEILPSGLCTYHTRFGARAQKCLPGCQWPKNVSAGH
ncbi:Uncharacterised protein r2_g3646 [Pycnogonum litorale]